MMIQIDWEDEYHGTLFVDKMELGLVNIERNSKKADTQWYWEEFVSKTRSGLFNTATEAREDVTERAVEITKIMVNKITTALEEYKKWD
jgi:hypothetical protein